MLARACGHAPWACACTCTRPVLAPSACTGFSGVCTMLAPCIGGCMHGVSCVDVCVNGRGSACTVLFTHACAPVGLHTAYIHTRSYIHTRGVRAEYVLCGVCAHVYGRGYVHGFFSCVHRTRPLTRVRAWAPKSHRGSARVGWHARPREGGAHTYLGKAALVGCAHSQQRAHATKARKKQRTRQRLNVFRWKAG